jgi:hypothetical protein
MPIGFVILGNVPKVTRLFILSEKERDTILRGNSKPKDYTAILLVSYPAFQRIANQSIGTPIAKCFTPNKNTEIS